jgi:hypothetical protein
MRRLRNRVRGEHAGEIVAAAEHGDRDACSLQAEQRRFLPRASVPAGGVDVEDGAVAVRVRAVDEPLDEPTWEP